MGSPHGSRHNTRLGNMHTPSIFLSKYSSCEATSSQLSLYLYVTLSFSSFWLALGRWVFRDPPPVTPTLSHAHMPNGLTLPYPNTPPAHAGFLFTTSTIVPKPFHAAALRRSLTAKPNAQSSLLHRLTAPANPTQQQLQPLRSHQLHPYHRKLAQGLEDLARPNSQPPRSFACARPKPVGCSIGHRLETAPSHPGRPNKTHALAQSFYAVTAGAFGRDAAAALAEDPRSGPTARCIAVGPPPGTAG